MGPANVRILKKTIMCRALLIADVKCGLVVLLREAGSGTGSNLRGVLPSMRRSGVEKLRTQIILSLVIIGIGVMLMIYMIVFEDEPGGIPLLLIVGGSAWYLMKRACSRLGRMPPDESRALPSPSEHHCS